MSCTWTAAQRMDVVGNEVTRVKNAMIKVVHSNMSSKVVDWAIQDHGAAGFSQDTWLP